MSLWATRLRSQTDSVMGGQRRVAVQPWSRNSLGGLHDHHELVRTGEACRAGGAPWGAAPPIAPVSQQHRTGEHGSPPGVPDQSGRSAPGASAPSPGPTALAAYQPIVTAVHDSRCLRVKSDCCCSGACCHTGSAQRFWPYGIRRLRDGRHPTPAGVRSALTTRPLLQQSDWISGFQAH